MMGYPQLKSVSSSEGQLEILMKAQGKTLESSLKHGETDLNDLKTIYDYML